MKLEELFLSREQMAHLRELGLDTTDALCCWIKNEKGEDAIRTKFNLGDTKGDSTYSINELMSILEVETIHGKPKFVDTYPLRVYWGNKGMAYIVPHCEFVSEDCSNILYSTYMAVVEMFNKETFQPDLKKERADNFLSDSQMQELERYGVDVSDSAFCSLTRNGEYITTSIKDVKESEKANIRYRYTLGEIYEKLFSLIKKTDYVDNTLILSFGRQGYKIEYNDFWHGNQEAYHNITNTSSRIWVACEVLLNILSEREENTLWEKHKDSLINDLISALNGDVKNQSEVERIMKIIRDTEEEDFIEKAEQIRRII